MKVNRTGLDAVISSLETELENEKSRTIINREGLRLIAQACIYVKAIIPTDSPEYELLEYIWNESLKMRGVTL
jgi:hypothetical protein